MRIWSIMLGGTALALGLASTAVAAETGGALPMGGRSVSGARPMPGGMMGGATMRRWGPQVRGRWFAGWHAPGGWAAYRRPVVGYVLPPYWISPAYRIGNYGAYGLPAPADGYGWSRYYDDAVMTDRDGRVRDHREGVDWDRGDAPPPPAMGYDDDVTAPDAPPPHEYEGRWTGRWRDDQGRTFNGDYEGRFEGEARGPYGVDYDAPPYAASPYAGPGAPVVTTTQAPGYYAGGYYFPGATTTTIVVPPAVTTTTTYVTETVSRRRHHRRK